MVSCLFTGWTRQGEADTEGRKERGSLDRWKDVQMERLRETGKKRQIENKDIIVAEVTRQTDG